MTCYCQIQIWPQPSIILDHCSLTPPPPTLSRVSAPQSQPQTAHFTESARPGFGHRPKLSFLIYEMGLIKPIIYVWHTHGQPPNCSPYLALVSHMHRCQINLSKLHNDHVISMFRKLHCPQGPESSKSVSSPMRSPQSAQTVPHSAATKVGILQD